MARTKLILAAAVSSLAACGNVDPDPAAPDGAPVPDAGPDDPDAGGGGGADAATALGPWSTPVRIDALSTVGFVDSYPTIGAGGRELYFVSNRDGGGQDLWVSTRFAVADPWGPPHVVTELDVASSSESGPELSADGRTLWYARSIAGQTLGYDLFVTTRQSPGTPWEPPTPVAELNTAGSDRTPHVSEDGLEIFFARDNGGNVDIYTAKRSSMASPWEDVRLVPRLSSPDDDESPTITADGQELYLHQLAGTTFTLMRATRPPDGGAWTIPQPVAELAGGYRPEVSPDGRTMLLSLSGPDGDSDLYESHREPL